MSEAIAEEMTLMLDWSERFSTLAFLTVTKATNLS